MTVKIYTTPTCAYCHAEKEFFKEHNVEFQEFDVFADVKARDEMVQKTGQLGVPVTDIDGQLVIGFDRAKIFQLLGLNKYLLLLLAITLGVLNFNNYSFHL